MFVHLSVSLPNGSLFAEKLYGLISPTLAPMVLGGLESSGSLPVVSSQGANGAGKESGVHSDGNAWTYIILPPIVIRLGGFADF